MRRAAAFLAASILAAVIGIDGFSSASGRGWCTVEASYNHHYKNYDVYVHSNQPHRSARVTDSKGNKWSYETNSNGYADVYLYVTGDPIGQRVRVEVGRARCSTILG